MICCIYDSINCLKVLSDFGGLNMNLKSNENYYYSHKDAL